MQIKDLREKARVMMNKRVDEQSGMNDNPINHPNTKNRTDKPATYYVTVGETDRLTSYDGFAMSNQQITSGVNNTTDFPKAFKTIYPVTIIDFAKKIKDKYPDKYVSIWRDLYSFGPQSKKGSNFARPGMMTQWSPRYEFWSNGLDVNALLRECEVSPKYSKDQIQKAITYWGKKLDEGEYLDTYCHDAVLNGPITTVKDLKGILNHFNDSDKIVVCDENGDPAFDITSIWNSDYESESTGEESTPNLCYIRIG